MPAPAKRTFCANAMKIAAGILCVWQGNLKQSVAKTVPFCRRRFLVWNTLYTAVEFCCVKFIKVFDNINLAAACHH